MALSSLFSLIGIGILYFLIYVFIPFIFLNGYFANRGWVERIVISYLAGTFFMTMLVFLLAFLKILGTASLFAALIACSAIFVMKDKRFKVKYNNFLFRFELITAEVYTYRTFFQIYIVNDIADRLKIIWNAVKKHPFYYFTITAIALYAFYYRSYYVLRYAQFGLPDMYVHLEWLKFFDAGRIFYAGIYPFAMHNTTMAVHLLTGVAIEHLVQYIGIWRGMLILLSLFAMLRYVLKSHLARMLALLFYCASGIFNIAAINRQSFFLPQEYGMIFLYPCLMFFLKYIENKSKKDLILFGVAFSMTLLSHFYITIAAILLCGVCALPNMKRIFKQKQFKPLIICVFAAIAVSFIPYIIGMIMGMPWEKSMAWAQNVIKGIGDDGVVIDASQKPTLSTAISDIFHAQWVYLPIACWLAIFVYYARASKTAYENKIFGISLYAMIMLLIGIVPAFGLPALMPAERAGTFLVYAMPVSLAAPVDVILRRLSGRESLRIGYVPACYAAFVFYVVYLFVMGNCMPLGVAYQLQYSEVAQCYYKIVKEFPKNTWTIVSNTTEYTMVLGNGFHYQLSNLINDMEDFDPERKIEIPTPYVFVFVEKQPLDGNNTLYYGEPKIPYPGITQELARRSFDEITPEIYPNGNILLYERHKTLEAKAYYWMQRYMQFFPEETRVYFETENLVVYEIRQNTSALNNMNLDYGMNSAEEVEERDA